MTDEKKMITGEVLRTDEPGMPTTSGGAPQGGLVNSLFGRVKKYAQVKEAELNTQLRREDNNLGDELVRKEEISLELVELKEKLNNSPIIQEGVKAGVIADTMESQRRVRDLKNMHDQSDLAAEVSKAELEAKLAKAKANAEYWNKKLDGETKPDPSRKDQIATLTAELEAKIAEYSRQQKEAGGTLDETTSRRYDTEIGRLMRRLKNLQDAEEDGEDQPPYED